MHIQVIRLWTVSMATKEALEAEAKALEDEAEALELAGRTIAAQAKVQQAKSKRNDAQRSAGMFATLRSSLGGRG